MSLQDRLRRARSRRPSSADGRKHRFPVPASPVEAERRGRSKRAVRFLAMSLQDRLRRARSRRPSSADGRKHRFPVPASPVEAERRGRSKRAVRFLAMSLQDRLRRARSRRPSSVETGAAGQRLGFQTQASESSILSLSVSEEPQQTLMGRWLGLAIPRSQCRRCYRRRR